MDWSQVPWSAVLTLTAMLSALILAALRDHFTSKFLSREAGNALGDSLRKKLAEQGAAIERLRADCQTSTDMAKEAQRYSHQVDRMLTEQWKRISEEMVGPIRAMSGEIRSTRELLIGYMKAQDNHARDLERMEKEIRDLRAGR